MQPTSFFHPFKHPWGISTHLHQSHWKALKLVGWLVIFSLDYQVQKSVYARNNARLVSCFSPCTVSYICSFFVCVCVCINVCVYVTYVYIYFMYVHMCVHIMYAYVYIYIQCVYMCVYMHNIFYTCIYTLYIWSNMRYCVGNWKAFSYRNYPSMTSSEQG